MGVLAPVGFVMPPALGAVFMSLSTIIVALNAQLRPPCVRDFLPYLATPLSVSVGGGIHTM